MKDSQIHYLVTHLSIIASIATDKWALFFLALAHFGIAVLYLRREREAA